MALILRKTEEGTRIEGDAPDDHTLAATFIQRELATGLLDVTVTLNLKDDETVEYTLQGFEPNEDGQPNLSAWVLKRKDA